MEANVDWIAPVVVLVVGLAAGAVVLLRGRRSPASAASGDDRSDLQGQFDSAIARLRELHDGAATVAGESRLQEITELEVSAARTLRDLERQGASPVADRAEPARVSTAGGNRSMRRLVWFTASCVAATVVYIMVLQSAKLREAGGQLTGNLPDRGGNASASTASPALASQLQRVEQNPNDLEARNDLARAFLDEQQLMNVFEQTRFVLEREPENARALAYQSLVLLAIGERDQALAMAQRALRNDPMLLDAALHLAIIQLQSGDISTAMQTIAAAKQRHPEAASVLGEIEREMRVRAASSIAQAGAGPAQTTASASADAISGEIRLADGVAARGGVLFLTVREEGSTMGAPIAVQRLDATSFPMKFSIGPEHAMQGRPFPAKARIEARIDSDGNPITRDPTDPAGVVDGIARGATNVSIEMRSN